MAGVAYLVLTDKELARLIRWSNRVEPEHWTALDSEILFRISKANASLKCARRGDA